MEPKQSGSSTGKFPVGRGTITKLVKVTVSDALVSQGWKQNTKGKNHWDAWYCMDDPGPYGKRWPQTIKSIRVRPKFIFLPFFSLLLY